MTIKLNPNEYQLNEVRKALKETEGYCPCSLLRSPDTKCMCKAFKDQTTPGPCHCGLYIKVNDN